MTSFTDPSGKENVPSTSITPTARSTGSTGRLQSFRYQSTRSAPKVRGGPEREAAVAPSLPGPPLTCFWESLQGRVAVEPVQEDSARIGCQFSEQCLNPFVDLVADGADLLHAL